MSISLTHAGTTLALSERMDWTDEWSWSPVQQSTEYGTTGALLVDVAVKQAGRPITLVGTQTMAWIPRAMCATLGAWAALPGAEFGLVLRGVARIVMFDHGRGGFEAESVWQIQDGEESTDQLFLPTFRFIQVSE